MHTDVTYNLPSNCCTSLDSVSHECCSTTEISVPRPYDKYDGALPRPAYNNKQGDYIFTYIKHRRNIYWCKDS